MSTFSDIQILDPQVRDHMDTFRVVFVRAAQYTILPELLEIFGQDDLLKFLDIFGGMTIRVPDRALLQQALRDTDIYHRISKRDDPSMTETLAVRYSISTDLVRDIYQRVRVLRGDMGL